MKSSLGVAAAAQTGAFDAARAFFDRCFASLLVLVFALSMPSAASAESVCAEVKIEIKQSVTLERQAFDAVLRVRNGLSMPVENLKVTLKFTDAAGNDVPATTDPNGAGLFFFRAAGLTDMTGNPDIGTGAVAGTKTGEARWLIIPTQAAGGQSPAGVSYQIGAKIEYTIPTGTGTPETRTVDVSPDAILVKPLPKIRLDYFLPGPVEGDDPDTTYDPDTNEPIIEPSVPFTLGVRVWNDGYGPAHALAIETAQPKIVDNRQGLLVDFRILEGFVDDGPANPSLTLGFGDVQPATARMGRWNMTASLNGQFEDFEATISHANELGGAMTAIIAESDIVAHKTLLRDVLADLPGRDGIRDFLADDGGTVNLYESDGALVQGSEGSTEVSQRESTLSLSGSTGTLVIAADANLFVYAKHQISATIAANGTVSAVRGDGKTILAPNVWLSKERDSQGTAWIHYVNVFDHHPANLSGNVSYFLTFGDAPAQPGAIRGHVYEDVDGDGARDAGEPAIFDAAVTLTGTDAQNNAVQRTVASDAAGEFALAGLAPGTYRIAISDVPGYRDGAPTVGSAGGLIGPNAIAHIVLGAGVDATGYAFAKTQTPQTGGVTGDLTLASLTSSTGTPPVGEPFSVIVTAGNDGPQAVPALVRLSLPAHLTLDAAAASVGTYDANTSTWNPGTVGVGATPTLTLTLRASPAGPFSIGAIASVQGAQTIDPATGNNARTLSLEARDPFVFALAAEPVRETRLLVLAGCPSAQEDNGCDDASRSAALSGFFTEAGVRHRVVDNEDDLVAEMRSGEWNTYWISSGAARKLGRAAATEISQAVLRQEWLIVDDPHADDPGNEGAEQLEDLMPVKESSQITKGISGTVTIQGSDFLPESALTTSGVRYQVRSTATDVEALASYDPEEDNGTVGGPIVQRLAAILRVNRTILTGFDLFDALSQNATLRPVLIAQLLQATRPELPATYIVGDYVAVGATATNGGSSLNAWLHYSMPAGATLAHAQPSPYDATSGVAWTRTIASGAQFKPTAGIRLSTQIGDRVVQVEARDGGSGGAPLATTVDVPFVVDHHDNDAMALRAAFDAADMPNLVQAIDDTRAAYMSGRQSEAILRVIEIAGVLHPQWIGGGLYTEDIPVRLGRLLRGIQREWYAQLLACGTQPISVPTRTAQDWRPVDPEAPSVVGAYETGPAWLFGFVSSTAPNYAGAEMDIASGAESTWQIVLDANGGAEVGFADGSALMTRYKPGSPSDIDYRPFRFGNDVELRVAAFPGIGLASMQAKITSINGQAVTLPALTADSSTPSASLSVRVPPGSATLDIVGKLTATYLSFGSGPFPTPPLNEMLRVRTTTSNVCRRPGA